MKRPRSHLWAGITLIAAPLLSVFAMAHHPSAGGDGMAQRLAEMVRESAISTTVHGGLIALMIATLIGFFTVAGVLGWESARVRAGAIAYSVGVVCMVGAALVSGFIVGEMAERYVDATAAEMEAASPSFHLARSTNQALAKTGAVAMSAGIFFWACAMLGGDGLRRGLAIFGLLVGLAPVIGLLTGRLELDVHGMLLVVVAQSLWTIGVGVWLLRAAQSQTA